MNTISKTRLHFAALQWLLGALWLVVFALHVWLHTDAARFVLAGGSDSGMAVSKIGVATSGLLVAAYLGTLMLTYFFWQRLALRSIAVSLGCLMAMICLLSGRVVAIGGVRGDLAVIEGWFMFPVRELDLSAKGVDDDVRFSQLLVRAQGSSYIVLTAGKDHYDIWTGPFIQTSSIEMLSYGTEKATE